MIKMYLYSKWQSLLQLPFPLPKKKLIDEGSKLQVTLICMFPCSYPFHQVNNATKLDASIYHYSALAAINQRVRERYGDAVLDIPAHETVLRPREMLQRLCDHLGVTCSEDYLQRCSEILYGAPSVTRNRVVWTEKQKEHVTRMTKKYPFLQDYSFDKYPN